MQTMADSNLASVCPICGSADAVHSCHVSGNDKKSDAPQTDTNVGEDEVSQSFVVIYLGSAHLDRRFPPQSSMPWVMGEIKRSRDTFKEVSLDVLGGKGMLKAASYEGSDKIETVFEHKLHSLSRFAKTHQDPRCFAYLRRQSLYSDFECHAFLAHEESVSQRHSTGIPGEDKRTSAIEKLIPAFDNVSPSFEQTPPAFGQVTMPPATVIPMFAGMAVRQPETLSETMSSIGVLQATRTPPISMLGLVNMGQPEMQSIVGARTPPMLGLLGQPEARNSIGALQQGARTFPLQGPPKTAAYRQSSYPAMRERVLLQNEAKRLSIPVPLREEDPDVIRRHMFYDDDDDILSSSCSSSNDGSDSDDELSDAVPELFKCIRGATQRDLFEDANQPEPEQAKACYEVMYVGRAKVKGKKIFSNHVDDLVRRLEAKETGDKGTSFKVDASNRRRHKSDTSIRSLPTLLDEKLVTENELQKLSKKKLFKGVELHNESPTGSNDDVHKCGTGDTHSDFSDAGHGHSGSSDQLSDGSSENMSHCSSDEHLKDMFTGLQHGHLEPGHGAGVDNAPGNTNNHAGGPRTATNRTMLFRVGLSEISLVSPDKKHPILERKFKNISSVSQGNIKADTFGFISREPGHLLICHLLRCCSPELVDEIMQALRTSFQTAYEHSRLQTQQICINCPLQQYHILCQDINGMAPEPAYNLLCRRIQQLPEKEATELYHSLQNENPQSHEESVEALMIGIRKICELRQGDHTHISDSSKAGNKSDFYLADMKMKPQKSAFDSIRNRARKTLTHSFESLLSNVQNKTEEVKEAFRHRSGTTDSEGGSFSKSMDYSTGSTPEPSPAPSPACKGEPQVHFDFPSPPPSPTSRPRSSTVGAVPDAATMGRVAAREEIRKKAELKEQEKRRASESPMKHMFILANASSPRRHSSGPPDQESDPDQPDSLEVHTPGGQRGGSWRQAIFNRVVTPARHPSTPTLEEGDEEGAECVGASGRTKEELRALWKKAILETLLLIRMEKENLDLRARQDEMQLRRQKLDYAEITPCLKEVSRTWDEMLTTPDRAAIKFGYNKLLDCVKKGVPQAKRGDIWWFLVEQHRVLNPELEEASPHVDYQELLKQLTTHQHAIIIDLGRTFPGHPYFSMQLGNGQLALFNLLKAYSLMDTDVGYCQGLSFVAGILLMHMDEVEAFEAWKHVMYNLGLRKQYRPNMIALQIQLYQLTRLLHDHYKDLYDHFELHEIAPTLYAAPWFLTLFASQFPLGFVARVFDLLFVQGVDVIFKVALVLLGSHKELIMQCDSFETIVEFIKTTLPAMGMIQMERVVNQLDRGIQEKTETFVPLLADCKAQTSLELKQALEAVSRQNSVLKTQVFNLDVSRQLQSYEVEYHVLKEEMLYSPGARGDVDGATISRLERANRALKQQNLELLEQLQHAHSRERSLESTCHSHSTTQTKLKSHIRTLELERSALLNAVAKLKRSIPESERLSLDLSLPDLTPNMPASPVHYGALAEEEGKEVEEKKTGDSNNVDAQFDRTKSARFHPEQTS